MDSLTRLRQLMNQQHMSEYKLSQASGIPLSTINSLFHKGNSPTLPTLEGLCKGLNISLSEFFYEPGIALTDNEDLNAIVDKWTRLTVKQQNVVNDLIDLLIDEDCSK